MNIFIRVETVEGEESNWLSGITEEEMRLLEPLLLEVKDQGGYFPTGQFLMKGEPRPEILYSSFPGWSILKGRLPEPRSGIKRILEVHVFREDPISLYM